MGLLAFYIQRRLEESPLFNEVSESSTARHIPLSITLRKQWKPMAILTGCISLTALSFCTFSTHMTTILSHLVGLPSGLVLMSNVLALTFATLIAPIIGRILRQVGG